MKYTHLGRSGLSVSRLCLGTINFGPQVPFGGFRQQQGQGFGAGIHLHGSLCARRSPGPQLV
jgi:aryl-alcohol dehydrogenase-like predicted oxidoreductase